MKPTIIYSLFLFFVFSCKESSAPENRDVQTPEKKEIIQTADVADNEILFSKFMIDLEREKFAVEDEKSPAGNSGYFDCERNTALSIQGEGIRLYHIKRKEAKPEYYYPDFVLFVYKFKDEKEAKSNFDKIDAALRSPGRFCNGKQPYKLVMNKNEVFSFSTRAEMFRGYINDFAEKVENY